MGMDDPVEIELDHEPASSRRGRGRFARRRSPVERAETSEHSGALVESRNAHVGTPAVTPPVDTAPVDAPSIHTPSGGEAPSRRSARAALLVGAVALVLTGFVLGRAGGSSDGSSGGTSGGDSDTAAAGSTASSNTTAPDDESSGAPTTVASTVDRSLVTLPSADASDDEPVTTRPGAGAPGTTRPPVTSPPPIREMWFGQSFLDTPTGIVVVGVTNDGQLAEIDLDAGSVRQLDIAGAASPNAYGSNWMHVGSASTVVGSWERSTAQVVPAGGVPYNVPGTALSRSQIVTAGPGPDLFWVQSWRMSGGNPAEVRLFDVSTGEFVGEPFDSHDSRSNPIAVTMSGGLLLEGAGGTYQVRDDAVRRITTGRVVAGGTNHLLVVECDEQFVCSAILIGPDGERTETPVPAASFSWYSSSTISPDGSMVAMRDFEQSPAGVALVDLATGETTPIDTVGGAESFGSGSTWAAWSDDSRVLLFLAGFGGRRLTYYDIERDHVGEVAEVLPSLTSFGVRRSTAPIEGPDATLTATAPTQR